MHYIITVERTSYMMVGIEAGSSEEAAQAVKDAYISREFDMDGRYEYVDFTDYDNEPGGGHESWEGGGFDDIWEIQARA